MTKNILSYYLFLGTSASAYYTDHKIKIDTKWNCIIGIAFQKIVNTNTAVDNIRVGFSNSQGTILNLSPLFEVWTVGTGASQKSIMRKCFIPVENEEFILNFAADKLTAELKYEVILLLDKVDLKKPFYHRFDYQFERILFTAGNADAYADSPEIKLKRHIDNITGILISSPCAGHVGLKYGSGDYILNRTNKAIYENSNGANTNEDRFFPLSIPKAKGHVYILDFAPSDNQGDNYYINLVLLVEEKPHTNLKGYGDNIPLKRSSKEIPTYPIYEFALFQRPENLTEEEEEACKNVIYGYREYEEIPKRFINIVTYLLNRYLPDRSKLHGQQDPEREIPNINHYKKANLILEDTMDNNLITICEHILEAYNNFTPVPKWWLTKINNEDY